MAIWSRFGRAATMEGDDGQEERVSLRPPRLEVRPGQVNDRFRLREIGVNSGGGSTGGAATVSDCRQCRVGATTQAPGRRVPRLFSRRRRTPPGAARRLLTSLCMPTNVRGLLRA